MKTLNLSAELSSIAMETVSNPQPPRTIISQIKHFLSNHFDVVGHFVECILTEDKKLDARMQLKQYDLRYENGTLRFRFMFFRPRGTWQIQSFRFVWENPASRGFESNNNC